MCCFAQTKMPMERNHVCQHVYQRIQWQNHVRYYFWGTLTTCCAFFFTYHCHHLLIPFTFMGMLVMNNKVNVSKKMDDQHFRESKFCTENACNGSKFFPAKNGKIIHADKNKEYSDQQLIAIQSCIVHQWRRQGGSGRGYTLDMYFLLCWCALLLIQQFSEPWKVF